MPQETEALGRSKGGLTTKIHTAVDALGNPAQNVLADKGYDSQKIVDAVEKSGAQAVIPPRSHIKNPRSCDFAMYAKRHRIECFFNKLIVHQPACHFIDGANLRDQVTKSSRLPLPLLPV